MELRIIQKIWFVACNMPCRNQFRKSFVLTHLQLLCTNTHMCMCGWSNLNCLSVILLFRWISSRFFHSISGETGAINYLRVWNALRNTFSTKQYFLRFSVLAIDLIEKSSLFCYLLESNLFQNTCMYSTYSILNDLERKEITEHKSDKLTNWRKRMKMHEKEEKKTKRIRNILRIRWRKVGIVCVNTQTFFESEWWNAISSDFIEESTDYWIQYIDVYTS